MASSHDNFGYKYQVLVNPPSPSAVGIFAATESKIDKIEESHEEALKLKEFLNQYCNFCETKVGPWILITVPATGIEYLAFHIERIQAALEKKMRNKHAASLALDNQLEKLKDFGFDIVKAEKRPDGQFYYIKNRASLRSYIKDREILSELEEITAYLNKKLDCRIGGKKVFPWFIENRRVDPLRDPNLYFICLSGVFASQHLPKIVEKFGEKILQVVEKFGEKIPPALMRESDGFYYLTDKGVESFRKEKTTKPVSSFSLSSR